MGLGMRLELLRSRRNRCAPLSKETAWLNPTRLPLYIGGRALDVTHGIGFLQAAPCRAYNSRGIILVFPGRRNLSMDLKTQALDRLLGLLSPALSQELD